MPIITISRQMGSGGIPIAHKVAETLGYTLIDGEAILEVADSYGLSLEAVEEADEKPPHFVDKLDHKQVLDLHMIELIILEYALKGNVIIYGRGGQDLLKDINSKLRVRIIAPFEERVERWAEREWLDPDHARYLVRKSDQQRAGFIKYYFDRDWDNPLDYDLIINTGNLTEEIAVKLICEAIKDSNLAESKPECKKMLSDLILRKKLEIAIIADGTIDSYLLEISVVGGVATFGGQLHSRDEKMKALKLATELEGIKSVSDQIRIVEYRNNPSEH